MRGVSMLFGRWVVLVLLVLVAGAKGQEPPTPGPTAPVQAGTVAAGCGEPAPGQDAASWARQARCYLEEAKAARAIALAASARLSDFFEGCHAPLSCETP